MDHQRLTSFYNRFCKVQHGVASKIWGWDNTMGSKSLGGGVGRKQGIPYDGEFAKICLSVSYKIAEMHYFAYVLNV